MSIPPPDRNTSDVTHTNPMASDTVSSIEARWECDLPEHSDPPWTGSVVAWPSWSAWASNARAGDQSRTVYSLDGQKLHPYMGRWADGGQITVVSGDVLIIEWTRGAAQWRETHLQPGDTYTISLKPGEDCAMIESPDCAEPRFTVSLANFHPQPIGQL